MKNIVAGKPAETEYAAYQLRYVSLVSDPDVVSALEKQLSPRASPLLLRSFPVSASQTSRLAERVLRAAWG